MNNQSKTEIITVLGQRGSGKSSWVKKKLPAIPRFLLWDTLGEYAGFDMFTDRAELFRHVSERQAGIFQCVFNCLEETEAEAFDWICELAAAVENVCLIVEEVDTYATPSVIPGSLRKLLKIGRHYGVSMIFVSRRPAEINRLITSQSQRFVCFRMFEPNDIRYLSSVIGPAAAELKDLPILHYLDWRHGVIERGAIQW